MGARMAPGKFACESSRWTCDEIGEPRGRNATGRPTVDRPQNTLTVTALLVLPWNWEEPRYWALNVKLPRPKNATVNVASATPLTTCTVALPRTRPLTSRSTVPPGATVPDAGLMTTVKVTVGGLNGLRAVDLALQRGRGADEAARRGREDRQQLVVLVGDLLHQVAVQPHEGIRVVFLDVADLAALGVKPAEAAVVHDWS